MSKKSKRTEHKKPWLGKRKLLYSTSFLPTLINKQAKQSYTQTFRFHSLKQTTFYPLLSNAVHQDKQIHFTSSSFTPFMYSLHYSSLYFFPVKHKSTLFFSAVFHNHIPHRIIQTFAAQPRAHYCLHPEDTVHRFLSLTISPLHIPFFLAYRSTIL